jgi:hypothetical protein
MHTARKQGFATADSGRKTVVVINTATALVERTKRIGNLNWAFDYYNLY